ncbi:hypothetical protein CDL15_Pgr028500 [Punica granatum]|uniref:GH10 domain-containing protein n=1 Tax=Punica granatum TaxID=22663 RepID=A0A218VWS8_PUNGR|nr:hypothetical protein CDL15_Pgr028500 [Punica granatum]
MFLGGLQCLVEPWKPHYGGGIISNPEFNLGISGWSAFGHGAIEPRVSKMGNRFIAVRNRMQPQDSISQKVQLVKGNLYTFSAWVQVSSGSNETVAVVFQTHDGNFTRGGYTVAKHGCWSLIKGGITANYSGPVELLFECGNTSVEIWVDSVSLQPFTKQQWMSQQDLRIEKARKRRVRFRIAHGNRTGLEGAKVSIKQVRAGFPFGCGMNYHILESEGYREWFASRFPVTTFTNEMKWYSTEKQEGHENYTIPDAMVKFAKEHNISIRGHNIFWDNPKYQPEWVKNLTGDKLRVAAEQRINSVVSRYAGDLIHWDCVNENLHFRFYEDNLGENATAMYFGKTHSLDPKPIIFMNEYNTIEYSDDKAAGPVNFKKKIEEILSFPGNNEGLEAGIGVQGHFGSGQPNLAYMRASLDILATTGLPIWLTEVSVARDPNQTENVQQQAQHLEDVLREAYAHPAVQGIIMFAGPAAAGFNDTTLVDLSFNNTPSGDVVDKLIREWKSDVPGAGTDSEGFFETSLFYGEYEVSVTHPHTKNSYASSRIDVAKEKGEENEVLEKTFHLIREPARASSQVQEFSK